MISTCRSARKGDGEVQQPIDHAKPRFINLAHQNLQNAPKCHSSTARCAASLQKANVYSRRGVQAGRFAPMTLLLDERPDCKDSLEHDKSICASCQCLAAALKALEHDSVKHAFMLKVHEPISRVGTCIVWDPLAKPQSARRPASKSCGIVIPLFKLGVLSLAPDTLHAALKQPPRLRLAGGLRARLYVQKMSH